jgi:serine O-acetyltransferase
MDGQTVSKSFEKTIKSLVDNYLVNLSSENFNSLPSKTKLSEIIDIINELIFPEYFSKSRIDETIVSYYLSGKLNSLYKMLVNQIFKGLKFDGNRSNVKEIARQKALNFIDRLPEIGRLLWLDIEALYNGDPAAKSKSEVILCYPTVKALVNHRVAHELLKLEIPYVPRMISELSHSVTGIDIHPGARIGERFCIDHGTGVVIGETCIIGNKVRLYQGVTLGAKRFELDSDGNPVKNVPRHPIISDNVIIYANATVLGRITVGENSVIGSNVRVTEDVMPNSKLITSNTINNLSI